MRIQQEPDSVMEPHFLEIDDDYEDSMFAPEEESDECTTCLGTGKWKCMSTREWNVCGHCGGTGIEGADGW